MTLQQGLRKVAARGEAPVRGAEAIAVSGQLALEAQQQDAALRFPLMEHS